MNEAEMIGLYEELIENLQTLNEKAPEIRKLFDNSESKIQSSLATVKNELSKEESKGIKLISELSSDRKKQIDEQIKALNDSVKTASKLRAEIGISTDLAQQLSEQFDSITKRIDGLKNSIDKEQQRLKKLEERIELLEASKKRLDPQIEIDYEELAPAIDLFNKYNGRIGRPIVLEKENYNNDYCFKVKGVGEGGKYLIGRYYRHGELFGTSDTFPGSTICKMYNGDTLEDVIAGDF